MSFASAVFAAGPYSVTYNSVDIGIMQGDQQSPALEIMAFAQIIQNTHKYGRTPIGAIGQGGQAFFSAVLMEYKAGSIAALWPPGATNTTNGQIPPVGLDWYDLSAALVLTALTGTLAATAGPATVTAPKAYLQEDFAIRYQMGPILKEMPLRMRLYPDSTATAGTAASPCKFWTNT